MPTARILLDARRRINSGIGRISQWLSKEIAGSFVADIEFVHLVLNDTSVDYDFGLREIVKTDITPFSRGELYGLPKLVSATGCELYVNPQLSWSPFHTTPTINIVHDLWAITNLEWLPTGEDFSARFRLGDLAYLNALAEWFDDKKATQALTPMGLEKWGRTHKSKNIICRASWAQFAATATLSNKIVSVSPWVKNQLEDNFNCGSRLAVIYNHPKRFIVKGDRRLRHILVLSKLEQRKNIETLLNAYEIYVSKKSAMALPLIIAGDPGYCSVASRILSRLESMRASGYDVHFAPSVTDSALANLLRDAAMLVFPSYFEGFGLPSLEAMLAGVQVLSTPTGMMATSLGQHAVLFNPNDAVDLANKLCRATEQPKSEDDLRRARDAVESFMASEDSKEKWLALIASELQRLR